MWFPYQDTVCVIELVKLEMFSFKKKSEDFALWKNYETAMLEMPTK